MQDMPLSLVHAFERAERLFGDKHVVTATPRGRECTTYAGWAARTRRLAGALDALAQASLGRMGSPGPTGR